MCNDGDDDTTYDLFVREVADLAVLQHANIVCLYGVCVDPSTSLTMAVCEPLFNGTLLQRLHHIGAHISVFELLRHAISTASALQYCATQDKIYRVVTCSKMLIGADNNASELFTLEHYSLFRKGANNRDSRCILQPSTLRSRCWV